MDETLKSHDILTGLMKRIGVLETILSVLKSPAHVFEKSLEARAGNLEKLKTTVIRELRGRWITLAHLMNFNYFLQRRGFNINLHVFDYRYSTPFKFEGKGGYVPDFSRDFFESGLSLDEVKDKVKSDEVKLQRVSVLFEQIGVFIPRLFRLEEVDIGSKFEAKKNEKGDRLYLKGNTLYFETSRSMRYAKRFIDRAERLLTNGFSRKEFVYERLLRYREKLSATCRATAIGLRILGKVLWTAPGEYEE